VRGDPLAVTASAVGRALFGPPAGTFVAALSIGTAGGLLAIPLRRPSLVFIVPGVLMLVPGSAGFNSLLHLLTGQTVSGIDAGFSAFVTAMAILLRADGLDRDPSVALPLSAGSELGCKHSSGITSGITWVTVVTPAPTATERGQPNPMAVREYQVVVGGELSDDAAPAFKGMRLERREGTTILVGRIRDQAELQGLLTRISELGLTLVSAKSIDG
jgi:hypothetical protein